MSNVKKLSGAHGTDPIHQDFLVSPPPRTTAQGIDIEGVKKQDGATKILRIGYPSCVQIHEQRLYNALILFGEIERIKCFASGHYVLVEFRSVEDARFAKDGLQGRLFNDPRIQILYSNCEIGPVDYPKVNSTFITPSLPPQTPSPSGSGSQFGSIQRFGPVSTIDSTKPPQKNLHVTETLRNVPLPTPAQTFNKFSDHVNVNTHGPGNWSKSSHFRHLPINARDANVSERESKKARIDDGLPITGVSYSSTPIPDEMGGGPVPSNIGTRSYREVSWYVNTGSDNQIMGETGNPGSQLNGSHDQFGVGRAHTLAPISPARIARIGQGECCGSVEESCCWEGTISKGGIPVCNARCISVGKSIEAKFPEVVNCYARTDLDTLTRHFYQASGFGLCYFVPQRGEDAHPYQEFLHYLISKNIASVTKFSNGTTMFLVPPSDFSENVLKETHRYHIFGVVLKFLQQSGDGMQQIPISTQIPIKEDPTQRATDKMPRSVSTLKGVHTGPAASPERENQIPGTQPASISSAPELNATITSHLTNTFQASSAGDSSSVRSTPTRHNPRYNSSGGYDASGNNGQWSSSPRSNQVWRQHQPPRLPSYDQPRKLEQNPDQQSGQHNNQYQTSSFFLSTECPLSSSISTIDHSVQGAVTSENIQALVSSQQKYGPVQDGGFGPLQTLPNHVYLESNEKNPQLESQLQQLQGLTGIELPLHGYERLESEANKNKKYQPTLQFGANLLKQQKQQQENMGSTQRQQQLFHK